MKQPHCQAFNVIKAKLLNWTLIVLVEEKGGEKYILEIQLDTYVTEFNVTVKMETFKWWIDLELLKDIYSTDLNYQTLKKKTPVLSICMYKYLLCH